MSDVRGLVVFVAFVATGCASSSSSTRRSHREEPVVSAPPTPRCRVRERTLAPVATHPRAAMMRALPDGLALAWTEHVGEHDTLRVLVVDAHGAPKSPSVEVTDRSATLSRPEIAASDAGYVVSWSEAESRFERTLDAQGRPRGDVGPSSAALSSPTPPSCGRDGTHLSCATPNGAMQLPGDEEPLSASPSGAVLSVGASGLRLWLNECR